MRIVHFSVTRLGCAPIRIVRALQTYSEHDVRLIELRRRPSDDQDIVFDEMPEMALEVAEKADIVHLHNYLHLSSRQFEPIDFQKLHEKGTCFICHFHSTSMLVAKFMGISEAELLSSPIPSLVIAQYPERFFPDALVVPNIVPIHDRLYKPSTDSISEDYSLVFTPSKNNSAWDDRWNTKGGPETLDMMRLVSRRTGCRVQYLTKTAFPEVMKAKREAAIVIDDLITGSYHLSALEGVSLAKPTLVFLDNRVQYVLSQVSGSSDQPFINVRLEDAATVLVHLLRHPEDMCEIGRSSRAWMENYWSEAKLVTHFLDAYDQLVHDPTQIRRQANLRIDKGIGYFYFRHLPDLIYSARATHYKNSLSGFSRINYYVRNGLVKQFWRRLCRFLRIPGQRLRLT